MLFLGGIMRKIVIVSAVFILAFSYAVLNADWVPEDGHKMHFPQYPNLLGWNVNATNPMILADDWMCSQSGPVTDVHFWGSWRGGLTGVIVSFNLSIHADIPADQNPDGYSKPGLTLWEMEIPHDWVIAQEFSTDLDEGWYDPAAGVQIYPDHNVYFQYNIFLDQYLPPEELFVQEEGTIYWLNISATVVDPVNTQWGWKSTLDRWNDDAVFAFWGNLFWMEMLEPPDFQESLNLSFVITGPDTEGACCYPDPTGLGMLCIQTTQTDCVNNLLGVYEGDGTVCAGVEACCLPDGSCTNVDALCCVNELLGVPQGAGSACTAPEACCFQDGSCADLDPLCCAQMGGTPQGAGNFCSAATVACCLADGSCIDVDPLCCDDLGGTVSGLSGMCLGDSDGDGNDDACVAPELDTCEYYKLGYPDYAPKGVPDFDQKQNGWYIGAPPTQSWTYCGPVALANCFWWFDSKFEPNPQDPRPFYPAPGGPGNWNDGYPLVQSYEPTGALWDDHDTNNVVPFIDSLALYCFTGSVTPGTLVSDLAGGAQNWLNARGLGSSYTVNLLPVDGSSASFDYLKEQVLASQNVILLLGFWQEQAGLYCERVGGHYVTIAGVCTDPLDSAFCISDPYLDKNEGSHGATIHNDADYISGPHGTKHHDRYDVTRAWCQFAPPGPFFQYELVNYGINAINVGNFVGQNSYDPSMQMAPPMGSPLHTIIEFAIIICPVEAEGACCYDDQVTGYYDCVVTTAADCNDIYGGTYQGDGTACGGSVEACCLPDGSCIMADVLCCVNDFNGTPQGAGTQCSTPIACCLTDGTCIEVDPLCCDDFGGTPSPWNSPNCMGDNNGNGTDEACEPIGACCLPDGSCMVTNRTDCLATAGASYLGDDTQCLGDSDANGVDDACEEPWPNHKMHYPQLPDESGWDVNATSILLADDWRCSESGPVEDIHYWGSWKDGNTGDIRYFIIQIYSDIPAEAPSLPYSQPGQLLWEFVANPEDFTATQLFPDTEEGWYDPTQDLVLPLNHQEYFRYDLFFDESNWFVQEQGTIYWLSINAVVEDPEATQWGWKSSINHFNDDAVWLQPGGGWREMFEPYEPKANEFHIELGSQGEFLDGFGTGFYGDGWYFYESGWWNMWFYDHPFTYDRKKIGRIEFDVFNTMGPGFLVLALNYSTPEWSEVANPPPDPRRPPLPWDLPEENYIVRDILYNGDVVDGHYAYDIEVPYYNPEWVSIDVQGNSFIIPAGFIIHDCVQSMDLSFVITSGTACQGECGDANFDGKVNVSDAVYLINYVFSGGMEPKPVLACGDANQDCKVNVSDAVRVINFVFSGGLPPDDCCPGGPNWYNGDCCQFVLKKAK